MSFLFAAVQKLDESTEYGLEDYDWHKPVLVFGYGQDAERFEKFVALRNSIEPSDASKITIERTTLRDIGEEFLARLHEYSVQGAKVVVIARDANGATREQINSLFSSCGVRILFGVRRYELLWLQDQLSRAARGFSLVTLPPGECVIDYGASSFGRPEAIRARLFAQLPEPSRGKFSSISADALRDMLTVFDHEIV